MKIEVYINGDYLRDTNKKHKQHRIYKNNIKK